MDLRTPQTPKQFMDPEAAEKFVNLLYEHILGRRPREAEFRAWTTTATTTLSPEAVFEAFIDSSEYRAKRKVHCQFPPGHYYSPVVDPETVKAYVERAYLLTPQEISGIHLSVDEMGRFWQQILPLVRTTPFVDERTPTYRYYYNNGNFAYGDAITLRAIIGHYRPKLAIEIGSGFSSACMLDAADQFELSDFHLVCIEPDPVRLKSLLRREDWKRVQLLQLPVQEIPVEQFSALDAGDILFIDSTHVLKTGSDVHYELFSILPSLKAGVLIHFHDMPFPFEYPREWVFTDNKSWNEIYAVRAFMMYNNNFRVLFWCSMLARLNRQLIASTFPLVLKNQGGSIWFEKCKAP